MSLAGTAAQYTEVASDIELVRATRAQADDAFEELYRRYHGPVARFVRGFLRDHGRAEDVTQEAFVSALRRIRQTESEIHFKPWIYEIARNAAIDHHRRSSRAVEVSFDADGGLGPADSLRLTPSAAPESSLIDRERFENFRGALDELSDTQHRILVLRELEGLSYREIGVRMELSSGAVESALFRARRKLESEYEQIDTGRRCARIRALMARLAEGIESGSDRRRLERHARRCWSCRRSARELGLGPSSQHSVTPRAVALLPLPAFLRRFATSTDAAGNGAASAREAAGLVTTPAAEAATQGMQKAVVVLASAIALGGGGATLGGAGPLAIDSGRPTAVQTRQATPPTRDRVVDEAPGKRRSVGRSHAPRSERGRGSTPGRPEGRRRRGARSAPPRSAPSPSGKPAPPARPAVPPPSARRPLASVADVEVLDQVSKPVIRRLSSLLVAPAPRDLPSRVGPKRNQGGGLVSAAPATNKLLAGPPAPR